MIHPLGLVAMIVGGVVVAVWSSISLIQGLHPLFGFSSRYYIMTHEALPWTLMSAVLGLLVACVGFICLVRCIP